MKVLCFIGLHSWKFYALVNIVPTGAVVRCKRCGKERYQPWL